jgi:tetratricopeptide (TPR) repeat protein
MGKAEPASKPSRSLSSEEADDPTIAGSNVPKHDPLPAARKAAEKAEHLSKKGRHEEAIALLRQALVSDPQYYEAANNLALELEAAGKADEAETLLRSLTKSAPEHVLAFSNLGTLLCQQHRYAEAEAVARQALERHKYSFKSNFLLGAALVDQGRWTDEAKIKLEYAQVKYAEAKALLDKWPVKAAAN